MRRARDGRMARVDKPMTRRGWHETADEQEARELRQLEAQGHVLGFRTTSVDGGGSLTVLICERCGKWAAGLSVHERCKGEAMIPAVIYAARSQAEQPGKDSTGDQIRIIRERIGREPIATHTDHASGFHGNRGPGLEAALQAATRAAAEHGRAELWVYKSERLARGSGRRDEARSVMEVYVDARRAGVDLRSVEDDEYFTNPMLVGIADAMAHKYSQDLSAHVKRGIASRTAKGKHWGALPYGFRKTADGQLEDDPTEAPIKRRIFGLYLEVGSYNGVARRLTEDKVPTRTGGMWGSSLIHNIIARPQEPLIDADTFAAAQRLAERGKRWVPKGGGRLPAAHVLFARC